MGAVRSAEADVDRQRAAARELYRREAAPLVRLATVLVGNRSIAEELVNQAFVKVYPRLGGLERPGGYLRTTVVNLATSYWRREAVAARHAVPDERVEPEPALPADVSEMWSALQRLSDRQREALVLRYYLDLPDDQIAEHLGVRPATVRSLVSRGLTALEKELTR